MIIRSSTPITWRRPLDQQTIVDGIKIARRIAGFEPAKSEIIEEYAPGKSIGVNDDEAILDWARNTSTTIYHPTGTCKMGDDDQAVVDSRLKVHRRRTPCAWLTRQSCLSLFLETPTRRRS